MSEPSLEAPSERQRVIEAFVELCAECGYLEMTPEAVAERAGVSTEDFERLFDGSLERCGVEAGGSILSQVIAAIGRSYSADRSEWDSVIHGVKAILELMAANPSFAYLGYIAVRQMTPPAIHRVYESGHQMLGAMLERGQAYSDGQVCPPNTARAALGGAEAIVRREIAAGRADRLPQLLPDFVYSATVPFLGQEEAMRLVRRSQKLLAETQWA